MKPVLALAACLAALQAGAAITVRDDNGDTVVLQQPAQRVVSLAPHVTELLFAGGGGARIVGNVKFSDYPPAARTIAQVGDNRQVDFERVLALKPDLLVVWRHNSSMRQMAQLRQLGIPLYYSEPQKLDDIPDTVLRLGQLLGTEKQARQSAAELRQQLTKLAAQARNRSLVRVFYQVWDKPLYTLNGQHIINDAIRLCGGENVFARLPAPAPTVNVEAVLLEDPEVVITGAMRTQSGTGLELWKKYPTLLAVRRGNLFAIDGDLLNRSGPRIIAGAVALCEKLEQARSRQKDRP